MPTGCTSFIQDGEITTGKDFLMLCARQFGATIEMRDEPLSSPIPQKFEADNYHLENVVKAKGKIEKLALMTDEEIENTINQEMIDLQKRKYDGLQKVQKELSNYQSVLDQIKNWNPPTKDHVDLKKFAIQQIEESIERDCGTSYYDNLEFERTSPSEWRKSQLEMLEEDLAYHEKAYADEVKRVNGRNEWIDQLRNSFTE